MMKSILAKCGTFLASLAFSLAAINANSACMIVLHQPELPERAKKLRRF